uniref:Muellerian-inhibiting factor-like n=1 Tax=Sinocyclocheilus anshuiensis TaxID=1608454 RepID=A0A671SC12_9TELE
MLFYARFWLILLLTVATGSCGAKIGHKEQDNSPMVTPISGWNGDEQDMARVPRSASEQPIGPSAQSTHATDVACDEEQLAHSRAMDDFLPALNRESELGRMENPLDEKPPSRTYLFLCELQKFLSDILPQKEGPAPQRGANAVSLDALHSLPPLSLGVSSTVSLLSGLVNSSTPTVFVFPERQQGLQTHRVEVTLDSPLLSVLRMRLDEAMAQVKQQEVGQKVIDRLQKLSELSALSPDGEDDEAVDKNRKEAQYRSILLLKALQVVLLTWEVERAQRAARADEDGSSVPSQCRLQSLTVSLRKFLLEPSTANINNCEGVCGFPLTNANNHAILLNSHIQSGQPVNRSLCCVPVDFDDLCVIELESEGTNIFFKTNVVATKCECR